jgi:hypothetical protein
MDIITFAMKTDKKYKPLAKNECCWYDKSDMRNMPKLDMDISGNPKMRILGKITTEVSRPKDANPLRLSSLNIHGNQSIELTYADGSIYVIDITKFIPSDIIGGLDISTSKIIDGGSAISVSGQNGVVYDVDSTSIRCGYDPSLRENLRSESRRSRLALGLHIRSVREGRGVSVAEVARQTGLSVQRIESGDVSPKMGDMRRIAQALGVTIKALLPV